MRLTAAYEGLKRLNARRQTALREGAELIFWSHGPAAESRWPRLAMSGAHRKMFLATARRETSGSPFIFTRSKNRSDSMQLRVIIGFKKIYLMPMMACPVVRRYVPQSHF